MSKAISDSKAVADLLRAAEAQLFTAASRRPVDLTLDWKNSFTEEAGVYVIFDKAKPIYIGESSNLRKRMDHMRYTYRHVIRWHLGHDLFSEGPDYTRADSKTSTARKSKAI